MPAITITISDTRDGAVVATDGDRPAIGRPLSPAQALAMDLLRTCKQQAHEVRFGADQVPLVAFVNELRDPDGLGHACTPEVRSRARQALGLPSIEGSRP